MGEWLAQALGYPSIRLLDLTPSVSVEATQWPGVFHRDHSDQSIVAIARLYHCPLVTIDREILCSVSEGGDRLRGNLDQLRSVFAPLQA